MRRSPSPSALGCAFRLPASRRLPVTLRGHVSPRPGDPVSLGQVTRHEVTWACTSCHMLARAPGWGLRAWHSVAMLGSDAGAPGYGDVSEIPAPIEVGNGFRS